MSLATYKKKRSFSKTPEPVGGKSTDKQLRFVVQKHDASHLHYDFRLQMEGILKSWAVPKGPSTDPDVKRLAMMVEDHPFDYRTFEGIIPKGQYGGGTVIVWDEGTYEPVNGKSNEKKSNDPKQQEKDLLQQLRKGKIVFVLHGQKLKGEYALVKSHYQGDRSWLLMKVNDSYAKKTDITKKDKSVISGKTISQVEKSPSRIYGQSTKQSRTAVKKSKSVKTNEEPDEAVKKEKSAKINKEPVGATKEKFPSKLSPMLATLVDQPFDKDGWLYEIKWDGYRCLSFLNKGSVELRSRNDKSFNEKFYPVYQALQEFNLNAVFDGEIVVTNENGISDFGKLQNWRSEADGELNYYVFDILWLNGKSLLGMPLRERRQKLSAIMPDNPLVRISQAFESTGTKFFEAAKKMGLEGILAKNADSFYKPGDRTRDWLKIKIAKRQEVVIGGFTKNEGSSKPFSSLLVGVFKNGELHYTGKIGTGFSEQTQRTILDQFKSRIRKSSPFTSAPDINKPSRFRPDPPHAKATWLKPELVCEVSFTEMTGDGVMRHPSFEGMRVDKKATDVMEEIARPTKAIVKNNTVLYKNNMISKPSKKERKTLLNPSDETQEREIDGHGLKFTNLSKLYWPKEKITKRDMLNYYYQVAPFILPYMKDRPQSLNRHPNGINGKSFYQKNVTGKVPDWIKTFPYHAEGDKEDKNFMVCTDEASLLYIASLGCIEMNPWSSRIQSPDNPDWCIIDLDPDNNPFDRVIEAAQVTRQILEGASIPCYCKTSGSTGLHIYIPLAAKYDYETSKEFARLIVTLVHDQLPEFTSIERATRNRKGKIYLDFLQNRPQATLATAYSIRPKPAATVSMPLHWEEVKKGLKMQDFTIKNAPSRLNEVGDIFSPVFGKGIDIKKSLKALQQPAE